MRLNGLLDSIEIGEAGSALADDFAAGSVVVEVVNPAEFVSESLAGQCEIAGVSYAYVVDVDESTLTVDPPLAADAEMDEPVVVLPRRSRIVAKVQAADSGEPYTASVHHALTASELFSREHDFDAGTGPVVAFERQGSEYVIVDVPQRQMVVDGASIDPSTLPPSEPVRPDHSPTPETVGVQGAILVRWMGVENATPVTYEVHVTTSDASPPDSSTLLAETNATMASIRTLADGTPLAYDTAYYVALVARSGDLAAEASEWVPGAMDPTRQADLAVDALDGMTITGATIRTASSGQRVEMTSEGLVVIGPGGETLSRLAPGETVLRGDAELDRATVRESLALQGVTTVEPGAEVVLRSSVADPQMPPTLAQGGIEALWPAVEAADAYIAVAWDEVNECWWGLDGRWSDNRARIHRVSPSGQRLAVWTVTHPTFATLWCHGLVAWGGDVYVGFRSPAGAGVVHTGVIRYAASGTRVGVSTSTITGKTAVRLGLDEVHDYPLVSMTAPDGDRVYRVGTQPSGDVTLTLQAGTIPWGDAQFVQSEQIGPWAGTEVVAAAAADGRTMRFWEVTYPGGTRTYTQLPDMDDVTLPVAAASAGITIRDGHLWTLAGAAASPSLYQWAGNAYASERVWIAYTATDGTSETALSPKASVGWLSRRWLSIRLPDLPGGTSAFRVYVGWGDTEPDLSGMHLVETTDQPVRRIEELPTSGPNPPAASDFPDAGTPGLMRSQDGSFELHGDGTLVGFGSGSEIRYATVALTGGDQPIATGVGISTPVQFNEVQASEGLSWNLGLHRFTADIDTAGVFEAVFNVAFRGHATGTRYTTVRINGAANPLAQARTNPPGAQVFTGHISTQPFRLDAGDYVTFEVSQSSGGSLGIVGATDYLTVATIKRIGD